MTNITSYPLEDNFETTLAQQWTGGTGTIYVSSVPTFTFPASVTTYLVVNPGKSTMQIAKVSAYDSTLKTFTVSSVTLNKGASVSSTAQTHAVGSKVIISDNYQFWEDIFNAVNSKIDGTTQPIYFYANSTARDAALGAVPTVNGLICGLTSESKITYSLAGSWLDIVTGSATFPNASETAAGKVEIATAAQGVAGTDTGETGAFTVVRPSEIAKNTQSGCFVYGADAGGDDTYVVALTPVLAAYTTGQTLKFKPTTANTGACTVDFGPGVKNIKLKSGGDPSNGAILANTVVEVVYDGTSFILQNPTNKFGGTGEDGAQGDAALTITGSDNTYITKNFTSWAAGSVARTCTVTPTGCITHIKIQGNADFTNWTFNFSDKGMPGGALGVKGIGVYEAGTAGTASTASSLFMSNTAPGFGAGGAGGDGGGGAGGGSGMIASGTVGTVGEGGGGGAFGTAGSRGFYIPTTTGLQAFRFIPAFVAQGGSGGGGGGASDVATGGDGGNGGAGGGTIIIEVGGNLVLTSSVATVAGVNGSNGSNATAGGGGAGGGGGGGFFCILYNGTLTGTLTPTVTAGTGGTGGTGAGGSKDGGNGGNGSAGAYIIEKNVTFN